MTIASQTRTAGPFLGTGSIVAYPFAFKVFSTADLLVQQIDTSGNVTPWTLGGNYTVVLNADQSVSPGGTITPIAALPVNYSLQVTSSVAATQPASLTNAGGFFPKTIEDALDRATILNQQSAVTLANSLRVPELGGISLLPAAAQRAGLLMGFDGNGNPIATTGALPASPVVATAKRELQTATASQTVFTLATMSYASATPGSLLVIVNGAVQATTAYTQTSPTVVTFASGVALNAKVEFIAGNFTSLSSGSFAAAHSPVAPNNGVSFDFQRNVNYAGGTAGFVDAAVRAITYVNNAGATNFEWALMGIIHNHATAGQNVGAYFQGNKYALAGPTWGSTSEIIDWGTVAPTSGAVGTEIDVSANTLDPNNCRVIADLVYRRQGGVGAAMECAFGVRFNSSDALAVLKTAIGFTPGAVVGIGTDYSPATITGAAIKMSAGQVIQLASSGTAVSTRQLFHNGSGLILQNTNGDPAYWQFGDSGALIVNGKQLLGAQVTGYALMTGTVNRATVYDTNTITLQQLAQRFAAFQNDVMNVHGFIHT